MPLIPTLMRQRLMNLCEFKSNIVRLCCQKKIKKRKIRFISSIILLCRAILLSYTLTTLFRPSLTLLSLSLNLENYWSFFSPVVVVSAFLEHLAEHTPTSVFSFFFYSVIYCCHALSWVVGTISSVAE